MPTYPIISPDLFSPIQRRRKQSLLADLLPVDEVPVEAVASPLPPERAYLNPGDALQLTAEPQGALAAKQPSPFTAREKLSANYGPDAANAVFPLLPTDPGVTSHKGEKRGFLGNLAHHLKHAGKGALLGLATGGLGGALFGGIGGGISPRFADTLEHNLVTKPNVEADRARIQKDAAAQIQRAGDFANLTDIDPFTGDETPQARMRRIQQQNIFEDNRRANEQFKSEQGLRQRTLTRMEAEDKEQAAAKHVELAFKYKTPVDPKIVQGTSQEGLGGKVPPSPPRKLADFHFLPPDPVTGEVPFATMDESGGLKGGTVPGLKVNPKPDLTGDRQAETASKQALDKARDIEREIQKLATEKEQKAAAVRNVRKPVLDENGNQRLDKQNRPMFTTVTESAATQEELTAYDKRIEALRRTQDDYVSDAGRAKGSKRLGGSPSRGVVDMGTIERYAKRRGVSIEEARRAAEREGYVVQ